MINIFPTIQNQLLPSSIQTEQQDFKKGTTEQGEHREYNDWLQEKSQNFRETCTGWREYKKYIEAIFATLPAVPDCSTVSSFVERYNKTNYSPGTIVLRYHLRQESKNRTCLLHNEKLQNIPIGGRDKDIVDMWEYANLNRNMPPTVEMIVNTMDKPRVPPPTHYLGLPAFVISGNFPVGAKHPKHWLGYLPFPSHFYWTKKLAQGHDKDFLSRKPKVTYRGSFSEHCWARFQNRPDHCNNTARFKLAYGTRKIEDQDVLDVKLTGFARKDAQHKLIQETLFEVYNITVGDGPEKFSWTDSQYVLAVSGNGWAGATMYQSMMSGGCTLFVEDKSIDDEGITRELGEIYFPLLRPGKDTLVSDYDTIASTIRMMNKNPKKASEIAANGAQFAKKFLGWDCAADVIELLAWNYYKYVTSGCPNAFSYLAECKAE